MDNLTENEKIEELENNISELYRLVKKDNKVKR